jgi:UDP-N-acetylmuramate dehydrogenase
MATQPHGSRSAGCFFKNPPDGTVGTGKMIDDLGMKGSRRGSAVVSPVHANFIVTEGEGARAEDALALAEEIRERVKREQGIELEYEVELWRANEPREKPQTDQSAERSDEESANGREST